MADINKPVGSGSGKPKNNTEFIEDVEHVTKDPRVEAASYGRNLNARYGST
jgi:hypothetical protein